MFKRFFSLILLTIFVLDGLAYFEIPTAQATSNINATNDNPPSNNPRQGLVTEAAIDTHLAANFTSNEQIAAAISGNTNTQGYDPHDPEFLPPDQPILNPTTINRRNISRDQAVSQRLIRIDRRNPTTIFNNGFEPRGNGENSNSRVHDHVSGGNFQSNFVSTSYHTEDTLQESGILLNMINITSAYVYEIYAPGGIDIASSLENIPGVYSNMDGQNEVAFFGGIQSRYIRSVREYNFGSPTGLVIQNPKFDPYLRDNNGNIIPGQNINIPEIALPEDGIDYEDGLLIMFSTWMLSLTCLPAFDPKKLGSADVSEDICPNGVPDWADLRNPNRQNFSKQTMIFGSDTFRHPDGVFQIRNQKTNNLVVLAEDRLRSAVTVKTDIENSSFGDWVFNYDTHSQSYSIFSSLNNGLILDMDESGRVFMGKDSMNLSQRWHITRDKHNRNLFVITNHANPKLRLVSDNPRFAGYLSASSDASFASVWSIEFVANPLHNGTYFVSSENDASDSITYIVGDEPEINVSDKSQSQELDFVYDKTRDAYSLQHYSVSAQKVTALKLFVDANGSAENKVLFDFVDNADDTQFWRIYMDLDGSYTFFNYANPGLVLEKQTNKLVLKNFVGDNKNQKWFFQKQQLRTIEDGYYRFSPKNNLDFVLDFARSDDTAVMYKRNGNQNQTFKVVYDHNKKAYTIASQLDPNMFLYWDTADNRAKLVNKTVDDYALWRLETNFLGEVVLRSYANTRTHFVSTGSSVANLNHVLLRPEADTIQSFVFESLQKLPGLSLSERVPQSMALFAHVDERLVVADNSDAGSVALQNKTQNITFMYDDTKKAYRVRFVEEGKILSWCYPIDNRPNANCTSWLSAHEYVGVHSVFVGENEQFWDVVENFDGSYLFINRAKPFGALGDSGVDETNLRVTVLEFSDYGKDRYRWQVADVVDQKSSVYHSVHPVDQNLQKNGGEQNKFGLQVGEQFGGEFFAQEENKVKPVVLADFVGVDSQQWLFVGTHLNNVEHIVSKSGNQYLMWDGSKDDGSLVVTSRHVADLNQRWVKSFVSENNNIFVVANVDHPNFCLARENVAITHGDSLVMQPCDVSKIEQHWFAEMVDLEITIPAPEVPVEVLPLDVSALHPVNNMVDTKIELGGGVGIVFEEAEGSFGVFTTDLETGQTPGEEVDNMFAASGRHIVSVYADDYSFVRQYVSDGFDLSKVLDRQKFYEQISVIEDNQFLVFSFENPLSFVSVGGSTETMVADVTQYVVQRKNSFFVAWLSYNLISDPVLQETVNMQLGKTGLAENVTQTDLQALTELVVVGRGVHSLAGLEYATNLISLTVVGAEINRLPQNFGQLQSLQSLVLSGNKLTQLPESLGSIGGLKKLDLSSNQLESLPTSLADLFSLVEVNVDNNLLADISVFKQSFVSFSAKNQTVSVVDGTHFLFEGFLQLHNVLLPKQVDGSFVDAANTSCVLLDFSGGFPNVDLESGCFITDEPDLLWDSGGYQWDGYTVLANVERGGTTFVMSFADLSQQFTGDVVYSVQEYVVPRPPTLPVYESVGVAKVEQSVDIKLPKSFGELVVPVTVLPVGLGVVSVGGELFLRGETTLLGVFDFVVETTHVGLVQTNFFSFETVSQDTVLLRVGEELDYREVFSKYVPGRVREYAVFGEHVAGLLPAGISFSSVWLDKRCLSTSVFYKFCWGSSQVALTGVPTSVGLYHIKVVKRGVDYYRFGFFFPWLTTFYDFGGVDYKIRVW